MDFGALLAEQASAVKLMMTVAQIIKHVDGSMPVRFLIAETETGYTLLAALWLARLFGVERQIEISPLFETAEALEQGATVLEEALRSPHYRAYLKQTGRLALQFGYSDSGRYVGQLAASYLIERLRLKIGQTLAAHGISGVEVILFDTHGESIGRGAHPGSLADRLKYLSPTASRQALNRAGLQVREEAAFQGGDGYLLFGTAGTGAGDDHPHRGTDLSPRRRPDRGSGLRQSRLRRGFLRHCPHRHAGAGGGRRLCRAAGCVRTGAAGQDRLAPGRAAGRRHGARRPHPPPPRAPRHPEQRDPAAARLVRQHAARHRRRRVPPPGTVHRSATRTAAASAAPWIWRPTAWPIPISTCCAR